MGPIPLRLLSHLPGSLGRSAGGNQPLPPPLFPTLPTSPPPVITSTAALLLFFFFSPGVLAQKKCLPQSHGGRKQAKPTAKQRQLGRSAGPPPGSAPPASSTRDLHAVVPPWSPAPPPLTPGFLAPEDKRRTQVKIMELSGKEKAAGQRGAAGGRYRSRSLPALPPFFRRSATLGARLSAEEITVRSITCQTLNWIGYFSPALLLTPSILETPKVLLGLYGLSHSVRAVSHALNSPVMRCMDFGLRKM